MLSRKLQTLKKENFKQKFYGNSTINKTTIRDYRQ